MVAGPPAATFLLSLLELAIALLWPCRLVDNFRAVRPREVRFNRLAQMSLYRAVHRRSWSCREKAPDATSSLLKIACFRRRTGRRRSYSCGESMCRFGPKT